ncbi:MAG: Helix-turn-helix domain [Chloroflexota bacterium]|jgi:transcriptional regulator with XRE-family HTH domain|nr:Helix-turn-helix domain [Chloroflexota bacterium]
MNDLRVSAAIRAVRIRRGLRQADVATSAECSRALVSLIERGHVDGVPVSTLRRVARVLEIQLDLTARWRGGDLDRLLNAGHAAFHESVARFFADRAAWTTAPEVTFSIYGERGVIDVVAWHAATRTILIIELKTVLVDVHDLIATADRRKRLGRQIAAERGWDAATVAYWVILANTRTNQRRIKAHETVLRRAFPAGGREIRQWLGAPVGAISALSLWTNANGSSASVSVTGRQRVRKRKGSLARA